MNSQVEECSSNDLPRNEECEKIVCFDISMYLPPSPQDSLVSFNKTFLGSRFEARTDIHRELIIPDGTNARRDFFRRLARHFDTCSGTRRRPFLRHHMYMQYMYSRDHQDFLKEYSMDRLACGMERDDSSRQLRPFFGHTCSVMQTIAEESCFLSRRRRSASKRVKAAKNRVANLHKLVDTLHELCLEKAEAVETTISDETIQKFQKIKL